MTLHARTGLKTGLAACALAVCACGQGISADVPQAQTVPLRYARPWQVLKLMHWDEGAGRLPAGVRVIKALPDTNALRVEGTPEGVAQVRDIAQNLDIKPRPVQIRLQFVRAVKRSVDDFGISFDLVPLSAGDVPKEFRQIGSGGVVTKLLDTLTHGGLDSGATTVLVTTNNVPATEAAEALFRSPAPDALDNSRFPVTADTQVVVSPRINSGDTITLDLSPSVSLAGPGGATTQTKLHTLRTVRSGETMVLAVFSCDADTEMLLFATPTLLPD